MKRRRLRTPGQHGTRSIPRLQPVESSQAKAPEAALGQAGGPGAAAGSGQKTSFWTKRRTWFASTGTVILTGVVTTLLASGIGGLFGRETHNVGRSDVSGASATASRQPLKVVYEAPLYPLDSEYADDWSFKNGLTINTSELKRLNSIRRSPAIGRWLTSKGGIRSTDDIQLVVQNVSDSMVRIVQMQVIKSCQRPWTGALYQANGGGAFEQVVRLSFNLDSGDPYAKYVNTHSRYLVSHAGKADPDYFSVETIELAPDKQQVFNIHSYSSSQYCKFHYLATIISDEKTVDQAIYDNGRSFRVDGLPQNGNENTEYSRYKELYLGLDASPNPDGSLVQVDPKTYDPGNPATWIPINVPRSSAPTDGE
jgi:hypothetical protein